MASRSEAPRRVGEVGKQDARGSRLLAASLWLPEVSG